MSDSRKIKVQYVSIFLSTDKDIRFQRSALYLKFYVAIKDIKQYITVSCFCYIFLHYTMHLHLPPLFGGKNFFLSCCKLPWCHLFYFTTSNKRKHFIKYSFVADLEKMCFGIGLGCCIALIEFLPFLGLVTVPLLGSFYGLDTVYRLSILLIVHSLLVECIPNVLVGI